MRSRRGTSLLEALVSLILTLGLMAILMPLLGKWRTTGDGLLRSMEAQETERVMVDLLDYTVRSGGVIPAGTGTAGPSQAGGQLRVRHYIGTAVRCGRVWRYSGSRVPDPDRDSVWWVAADGRSAVAGLASSGRVADPAAEGCPDTPDRPGRPLAATPDSVPNGNTLVLLRVFERGRFSASDAFRYGRGGTAPQPLTAANLIRRASEITTEEGSLTLRYRTPLTDSGAHRWWLPAWP